MSWDRSEGQGYTDTTPEPLALEEQLSRITAALAIYAEASKGHYPRVKLISQQTGDDCCRMLGLAKPPDSKAKKGTQPKARRRSADSTK